MSRQIRSRAEYESGSKWFADWHRAQPDDNAGMVDLDGVGYCRVCSMPLYLVEATKSKTRKTATVTENLGKIAGLEVFVFYAPDERRPDEFFIDWRNRWDKGKHMAPSAAWELLISIRNTHICMAATWKEGT